MPAGVAGARFINGHILASVLAILNDYPPAAGEEHTVARVAGGQHAIEHVRPKPHEIHKVLRRANTHNIARLVHWQLW